MFAAIPGDASDVSWDSPDFGGDSSIVQYWCRILPSVQVTDATLLLGTGGLCMVCVWCKLFIQDQLIAVRTFSGAGVVLLPF